MACGKCWNETENTLEDTKPCGALPTFIKILGLCNIQDSKFTSLQYAMQEEYMQGREHVVYLREEDIPPTPTESYIVEQPAPEVKILLTPLTQQ